MYSLQFLKMARRSDVNSRERFSYQPIRVTVNPRGKPSLPTDYNGLFAEMYGIDNYETVDAQNPDARNYSQDIVEQTNLQTPFELAAQHFAPDDSCLMDSKLAASGLQRGKRAQAQMVFRSAMTRNPAQKFFIDELEDNEKREWWDQKPELDDSLYKTFIRGLADYSGEPLDDIGATVYKY